MTVIFLVFVVAVLEIIPKDNNSYLCEYKRKLELIEKESQPRMILIGGSNIAFGVDSKRLQETFGYNVINFGLHAGIGIRYPMEDYFKYAKKGDIVILQFEYSNFFGGDSGESGVFSKLIYSIGWKEIKRLNLKQLTNLTGLPQVALGRIFSLIKYPITNSFNTNSSENHFEYTKNGFNEFGDEVSHFNYKDTIPAQPYYATKNRLDLSFIAWLNKMIISYEEKGVTVLMMPPVCSTSVLLHSYDPSIEYELSKINHPYIVSPAMMTVDNSCIFDAVYHVNRKGKDLNTERIISELKYYLN